MTSGILALPATSRVPTVPTWRTGEVVFEQHLPRRHLAEGEKDLARISMTQELVMYLYVCSIYNIYIYIY